MEQKHLEHFIRKTANGKQFYEFNTLYELGDLIEKSVTENYRGPFAKANLTQSALNDLSRGKSSFAIDQGTNTISEAIHLLKYGWDHGTQKINANLKMLSNSKSMKIEYSVVGGQVSVPRHLQGLPTNMIKTTMVEKPLKILNVYKSAGYSGFYSEEQIIENSAKALQIVEMLESKGYRINLYVVKLNEQVSEEFFVKVKVKSSNERLNIKKTAFCLANPAFQRRILWRLIETCPWISDSYSWSSYGRPVDSEDNKRMSPKYLKYMPEKNKVFIPILIPDVEEFVKNLHLE